MLEEPLYHAAQIVGKIAKSFDINSPTLDDVCRQLKGEIQNGEVTLEQKLNTFNYAVDVFISTIEVSELLSEESYTLDNFTTNRLLQFLKTVNQKNTNNIFMEEFNNEN